MFDQPAAQSAQTAANGWQKQAHRPCDWPDQPFAALRSGAELVPAPESRGRPIQPVIDNAPRPRYRGSGDGL